MVLFLKFCDHNLYPQSTPAKYTNGKYRQTYINTTENTINIDINILLLWNHVRYPLTLSELKNCSQRFWVSNKRLPCNIGCNYIFIELD